MGGAWFHNVFGAPEEVTTESLLQRATEAVCCHLGVSVAPSWSNVALHMVQQDKTFIKTLLKYSYYCNFIVFICVYLIRIAYLSITSGMLRE